MKAEPNKVIEEIIDLRVRRAFSSTSLVEYLKDTYDINQSRAYELIRDARIKMGEIYNEVNTNALEDSILLMENMLQGAIGRGETKMALDIQKELNKVQQLYIESVRVEHNGSIDVRNLFGFESEDVEDDKTEQ
jgi:hypothetical protein